MEAVSFDYCIDGFGRDGILILTVLPGEEVLFLRLADLDLSHPGSSGYVGKASAMAMDVGSAAVPGLVEVAHDLGFEEALNRSCEPFGDPPRESSMVAEDNQEGSVLATSKKNPSK